MKTHHSRVAMTVVAAALMTVSCSRENDSGATPEAPSLSSGFMTAEWRANPCSGDPCLTKISLVNDPSDGAYVIVSGAIDVTIPVTRDEVRVAYDAVARAIQTRGATRDGCGAGTGEWLVSFAGDAGNSAPIQGCTADEVEAARNTLRAIAEQHTQ